MIAITRTLVRYVGLPAAIGLTLFSTHKAYKAYQKLKALEAELINPLKKEAAKWANAISQIGGAEEELTFWEKRHSKGTGSLELKSRRFNQDPLIEKHYPDPEKANELICYARQSISESSDKEKSTENKEVEKVLLKVEHKIRKQKVKNNPDYSAVRQTLKDTIDHIKMIRSDYDYEISKRQKQIDVKFQQWLLSAGISVATAGALGSKGLNKVA